MNKKFLGVCNMAFSYLLFEGEGVVWPVIPMYSMSSTILARKSLENKRQWARFWLWNEKNIHLLNTSEDNAFIHK